MGVGPWAGEWPTGNQWDPDLLTHGDRRNVEDRYRYWRHDAIVAELRRRGIDQVAIDAALDAAADDADDEFLRAIDLAEKRARALRGLDRATAERRLAGFLMRKGYGSGVVRIAVERALDGGPRTSGGRGTVRFE